MQKRGLYFLVALSAVSILASSALAKVWLLPDYQQQQFYSHRKNDPNQNHNSSNTSDPSRRSCSSYGGIEASSLAAGIVCESPFYIGSTKCCRASSCSSDYKYTSNNCEQKGMIGGGQSCTDDSGTHYTTCKCSPSLYPYSSSSCVPELSGNSCTDDEGTHYQECVEDPCADKEEVSCAKAVGCAETCGDICVQCNPKPDCDAGSHWNDDLGCVLDTCPVGYATSSGKDDLCGLAISNSHWELGVEASGQVGSDPCYNCILTCDEGYGDYDTYWCNTKPKTIDCETLGYSKASTGLIMCANGMKKVFCPFDTTYYTCVGIASGLL